MINTNKNWLMNKNILKLRLQNGKIENYKNMQNRIYMKEYTIWT